MRVAHLSAAAMFLSAAAAGHTQLSVGSASAAESNTGLRILSRVRITVVHYVSLTQPILESNRCGLAENRASRETALHFSGANIHSAGTVREVRRVGLEDDLEGLPRDGMHQDASLLGLHSALWYPPNHYFDVDPNPITSIHLRRSGTTYTPLPDQLRHNDAHL